MRLNKYLLLLIPVLLLLAVQRPHRQAAAANPVTDAYLYEHNCTTGTAKIGIVGTFSTNDSVNRDYVQIQVHTSTNVLVLNRLYSIPVNSTSFENSITFTTTNIPGPLSLKVYDTTSTSIPTTPTGTLRYTESITTSCSTTNTNAQVSGKITDVLTGRGVGQGVIIRGVTAYDANNRPIAASSFIYQTCAFSAGYSFNGLPINRPFTVETGFVSNCNLIDSTSYANEYWQEVSTIGAATSLTLPANNARIENINFTLLRDTTSSIIGTVTDSTGNPLGNIGVKLTTLDGSGTVLTTCTGANGKYQLRPVNYSTSYLVATYNNNSVSMYDLRCGTTDKLYVTEYWQESATVGGATPVSITPQSSTLNNIDFTLDQLNAYYIAGQVVDQETGQPLAGIEVVALSASMPPPGVPSEKYTCTDSNGNYRLDNLLDGMSYRVRAASQFSDGGILDCTGELWQYSLEYWQEKTDSFQAQQLTFSSASNVFENINFTLSPIGVVTGSVTEQATALPIANIQVTITYTKNLPPITTCTDSNGNYRFEDVYFSSGFPSDGQFRVSAGGANSCTNGSSEYSTEYWQEAATSEAATVLDLIGVPGATGYLNNINFTLVIPPPAATTLTVPEGTDTTPVYSWTAISNATSYRLYITDLGGAVLLDTIYDISVCSSGTCSVEPETTLTANATYNAWVQSRNGGGGTWSEQVDFSVLSQPLDAPVLTAPTGLSDDTTPNYAWEHVAGATSYRLYVTDSVGAVITDEIYTDLATLCPANSCMADPGDVLADGSYSAWVQALNAMVSTWSEAQLFTISTVTPPAAPILTAPPASGSDTTPDYTWNHVTGATSYRLYVTDSVGAVVIDTTYNDVATLCPADVCTTTPATTLSDGSHTAWVQASNAIGSTWSDAVLFNITTATPPAATAIPAPSGAITDTTPTYTWNEISGVTSYRLYVSDSGGTVITNTTYDTTICGSGSCSVDPGVTLTEGMSYTAWVLTSNASGNGPWSNPANFTITLAAPAAPTLIAPTGAGAATQPTYDWNEAAAATQYRLYVQDVNGTVITNEVVTSSVCTAGTCSYTPTATLNVGTEYLWWVLAANAGGGAWSSSASFVPGSVPGTTTITAPVSPTSATQPTYEWNEVSGASNYRLYVATSGGTLVLDQVFPSSNCTAGVCSVTPAVTLTPAETYQAWVLASNAVGNGSWSAGYFFAVNP